MDHDLNQKDHARYDSLALIQLASQLLQRAGLQPDRAEITARTLVEADLMGHTTHGLNLLPAYVQSLEKGGMTTEGEPDLVSDRGSAVTWDGGYLPGPWLVHRAIDLAFERIAEFPVMTIVIRRCHHIGCLAAYPLRATERGLVMLLSSSDPNCAAVAPFGGVTPVYTPNPLACGIPTSGDPILFDTSMSLTAIGPINRAVAENRKLEHPWLLTPEGNVTDDPRTFAAKPPSTILPLGGMDAGYKGFALGLMIEALTCALGGHGRADHPGQWGAAVFLQVIDPAAFGGKDAFVRETDWLAQACKGSATAQGAPPVRLPGQRALQLRAEQTKHGIALHSSIPPALKKLAERFGLAMTEPVESSNL